MHFFIKDMDYEILQILQISLAGWLDNVLGSKSAVSRSPLYLDVTALSPVGSPTILDQPVILAILGAISHSSHFVVVGPDTVGIRLRLTASLIIIDTTAIVTPVGGLVIL